MALIVLSALLAMTSALLAFGNAPPRGRMRDSLAGLQSTLCGFRPVAAWHERERDEAVRRACLSQMPVLLDVLTLGLSAGLSFDASLEMYCMRYGNELARELSDAMSSWRMGLATRSEALTGLAHRLEIPALQRFASAVTEAIAFGSPLAEVLEHQAQAIRDEHRSQVEEAIEKVPVKMLIPLGTLIVPAMLLAILGPLMGPALQTI